MNWRPMVTTDKHSWNGNALVFATKEEAEESARELMNRWYLVLDTRADETDKPVSHKFVDGKNVRIEDAAGPSPKL